jgi:uncharacterized damage-inducible protein DinB
MQLSQAVRFIHSNWGAVVSTIAVIAEQWKFNRERSLATLGQIAELPDPQAVLGWRPGPGRAHIAWQFMHIGVTEELFATERLDGSQAAFKELVARFKGGSTPDDNIPSLEEIRDVLSTARQHLLAATSKLKEEDLSRIPESLKERGWTQKIALQIVAWHEPHHQGQAHATLNAWKLAHK